jgi:hypothetical protein
MVRGRSSDGRAFRAEMRAQDQISMLTLFFSTAGLESLEPDAMKRFVEEECLITFKKNGPTHCDAALFRDDGGNQFWSVNIVVGNDDDRTFIDNSVPIFPYSNIGEPNTIFNPAPIKAAHRFSEHSQKGAQI